MGDDVTAGHALAMALAAHQWLVNRRQLAGARYIAANLAATAAVLVIAHRRGLSTADLGLERCRLGVRTGATVATGTTVVLAALWRLPASRRALTDARVAGLSGRDVAWEILVRIPLGTVVLEEVAFRAVLPALTSPTTSSVLFGFWHVPPTLRTLDINGVRTTRARVTMTAAAVASTTLAGAGFYWLRRRAGLAAPLVAHSAINGLTLLTAAIAHRSRGPVACSFPPDTQESCVLRPPRRF